MTWAAIRTGMGALLSHWGRHPMQLLTLLVGLALATALWSGVQAINSEARAAYARAAAAVGEDTLERIVAEDGGPIRDSDYVALRRAGWLVSPLVEGRHRASGLRVIGIDPLTLPAQAAASAAVGIGGGDFAGFLGGTRGLADAETIAAVGGEGLPGIRLDPADGLPPMTVILDVGAAQRLLAANGRLDALILAPGPHPNALPPHLVLRAAARDGSLARLTDSFHLNLTAFGFLAFAVGLFIVHSAIGLAFEQRRAVFRTLRALGLSAGALTGLLVAELLVLAIAAGLLGVALGYLVAAALLPDVGATLGGLYGATVPGTLSIRAEWWATGLAIAVLGTLAAAGQSLWRLWHMPVLAPAQARAWALAATRTRRLQLGAAGALLAASAGLVGFGQGLWAAFGGLGALLLGAALALPSIMDAVVRVAQRQRSGVLWDWFWADTRQQLPGLSLALMALLLAMAANIGVGTMVTSFRTTFVGWLDQRLASELYLTAASVDEAARLTEWLRPRTDAILPIVSAEADLIGQPGSIYGVADHATYRDHWPLLQAVDGVWDRVADGTGVLVNEQMARRGGLGLGAEVALPGGALPIVGVYSDYGNPSPQALIGLVAALRLAWASEGRGRRWWVSYAALLAGALTISLLVARAASVSGALAVVPLGWQLMRWLSALKRPPNPLLRVGELVVAASVVFVTLLPVVPVMAVENLFDDEAGIRKDEPALTIACNARAAQGTLAALPAGGILAPLDMGPDLLINSNRSVLATGHHRGAKAMRLTIDAFSGTPEQARAIMQAKGLRYLAICPRVQELDLYEKRAPRGFGAQLKQGKVPAWLEPVPMPAEAGLRLWRRLD